MYKMIMHAPEEHRDMLNELRKIPFAKTNDGYRFASWVYDLNHNEQEHEELLESPNGKEAAKLLYEAKEKLENIFVSEDDYLSWTVYKKETGGIAQYHKVIHELSITLFMLNIDCTAEDVEKDEHKTEESLYTMTETQSNNNYTRYILNRNNPFADVTIKSQQFYYKTVEGGTETLFFDTNNIIEKIEKSGRNLLTMRPSFSVTKEHGAVQKPIQKVTFANSITESIVSDEDHIYIHID